MNQGDKKRILFLTTSNLTTNPRMVKEIELAEHLGFESTVICFQIGGWSEKIDKEWESRHPNIQVMKIPATRKPLYKWLLSTLVEWTCRILFLIFKQNNQINAYSSNKRSFLLNQIFLKNLKQFNFIVAHNMGTLFPAWKISMKFKIPFIFDVEDYYPGEHIGIDSVNEKRRREYLLQQLLPWANLVTVASPLIGNKVEALLGQLQIKQPVLINNCFPASEFEYVAPITQFPHYPNITLANQLITFVWFSQNIAANRGLELIIPVLNKYRDKVHLHLVGNLYSSFNQEWIEPHGQFISTHAPMPQHELNRFIGQFDIGLALEPGKDENNLVAISNKIWAYLQAGLYILATNTPAQVLFLAGHQNHGCCFSITPNLPASTTQCTLHVAIEEIIQNSYMIRQGKAERFYNARYCSWETESKKLLEIWGTIN